MNILQRTARPVFAVVALAPRCIRCEAPAIFSLCDTNGKPLAPRSGGFCAGCAPTQGEDETTPSTGTPAALAVVEAASDECAAFRAARVEYLSNLRSERAWLRHDLALMENCADDSSHNGNGPTTAEIAAAQTRLNELDEMLVMDDERPFVLGFDDLPTAYFEAQATAQHAALSA